MPVTAKVHQGVAATASETLPEWEEISKQLVHDFFVDNKFMIASADADEIAREFIEYMREHKMVMQRA